MGAASDAHAGERPSATRAGHATEACSPRPTFLTLAHNTGQTSGGPRSTSPTCGHSSATTVIRVAAYSNKAPVSPIASPERPELTTAATSSSRSALVPWSTERHPSALRPAHSAEDLRALTDSGARRAHLWESIRWTPITSAFRRAGVELPRQQQGKVCSRTTNSFQLNKTLQAAMSEYICRVRPSLKDFTELIRGQTPGDYRPNKALLPSALTQQCRGYPQLDDLLTIASDGVRVRLRKPIPRQTRFPRNHPSASARLNVLRKNIRKAQDLLRCLVVDADIIRIWSEIVISPFGVVGKGDGDPQVTGRTIHDLSIPEDGSVNHCTDPASVPKASLEHCSRIAWEIVRCKQETPECEIKVT
ncbi:hypothetical protein PR001_g6020 [Phytophthora rubi]|nr:hypothetical protein PR001_g6020 [Phytophthora rubi]